MVRRQNVVIGSLVFAVVVLAFGYVILLPLKESIPYTVEVNKTTGEVSVPKQQEAVKFTPSEDSVLFFVRRWIKAELQIQPQSARENEALATSMLRGDVAINKHRAFRSADATFARLGAEPTLVRDVSIESVAPVAGGSRAIVANITLTTTSRGATVMSKRLVTIYYEILPPKTRTDREQHPIGLYIVDFRIDETT